MFKNKKIIIVSIIFLVVLIVGTLLHIYNKYCCSKVITSSDKSFNITIPNRINYKVKDLIGENYSLELYSVKDEMFIYTTELEKSEDLELEKSVIAEKDSLIKKLSDVNVISDVSQIQVNNYNAFKYAYTYKDESLNKDLYSEVVWIEADKKIYILDLEVIIKNMEKYKKIFENIETSFEEN